MDASETLPPLWNKARLNIITTYNSMRDVFGIAEPAVIALESFQPERGDNAW